ncbi:LicD family protein [Loktanella sp. R86503]|uniref:LicD family protein n=1 Tax=Loktanella sp. R86503 TaxID=3093847 RepID=UPI0036DCE5EB
MASIITRLRFSLLRWLRQPHTAPVRLALAGGAWLVVLVLSGRLVLAQDAARLFKMDEFKTGAHRIVWYLHYGWTGRFLTSPRPMFDPTTSMSPGAMTVLDQWLGSRNTPQHKLALLNIRAKDIMTADTAAQRTRALRAFTLIANDLVSALQPPRADAQRLAERVPEFSITQAQAALQALNAIKMPWFIVSGTFLGAVREGNFLPHDYDIDIGIDARQFDEAAFWAQIQGSPDLVVVSSSAYFDLDMQGAGPSTDPCPALYRLMHASGIGIDVFVHYTQGEQSWHGSAKHRWTNSTFDLDNYEIAGMTVRGPADADRYLSENYGDWRTPQVQFNCSTDTPNVSFPHNPAAVVQHLNIALMKKGEEARVAQVILWQEGYLKRDTETGPTIFTIPWTRP